MSCVRLAALIAIVGCGAAGREVHQASGDKEPIARPDPSQDGPKPEHLEVVATTVAAGGEAIFIKADGAIELKGSPVRIATLRRTGELLHENGGLLLTLQPDGTIIPANRDLDPYVGLVIGPNGELTRDGELVATISVEGLVFRGDELWAKVSGPELGHRAAMLIALLFLSDGDGDGDGGDEGGDDDKAPDLDADTAPDAE